MAGLLDAFDSDQFRLGLGLLAAGGARGDGMSTGGRIQEAFTGMDARRKAKTDEDFRKVQMEEALAKRAQKAKNDEAVRQMFSPMQGGQAMQNGQGPTNQNLGNLGQMQKFDPRQFMLANPGADMDGLKQAMELDKSVNPAAKYESYGPDSSVYKMGPNGPELALTTPGKPEKPDKPPTKVQEFEYAKQNGYKGSFEQFVTLGPTIMAGAMAPLRQAQVDNITSENAYNLPPPRRAASGGGVIVMVNGKPFSFPDQKSANNYKLKAGVR